MLVTSVLIYPVKSMGGVAVDAAGMEPWGIAGDRRWGLIDDSGQKITAREVHSLLRFRAEVLGEDSIRIRDRAAASILATTGSAIGSPCRCASSGRQDDPTVRTLAEDKGGMRGEHLSLADAGPLLLASEASMAQLNAWIQADAEPPDAADLNPADSSTGTEGSKAVDIARFRPSVVIDGEDVVRHPAGPARHRHDPCR